MAIAVASEPSIVVKEPVECSSRSKNAAFCLNIDLKDTKRTRLAYLISELDGDLAIRSAEYPKDHQ